MQGAKRYFFRKLKVEGSCTLNAAAARISLHRMLQASNMPRYCHLILLECQCSYYFYSSGEIPKIETLSSVMRCTFLIHSMIFVHETDLNRVGSDHRPTRGPAGPHAILRCRSAVRFHFPRVHGHLRALIGSGGVEILQVRLAVCVFHDRSAFAVIFVGCFLPSLCIYICVCVRERESLQSIIVFCFAPPLNASYTIHYT